MEESKQKKYNNAKKANNDKLKTKECIGELLEHNEGLIKEYEKNLNVLETAYNQNHNKSLCNDDKYKKSSICKFNKTHDSFNKSKQALLIFR